jgi:hypothetical protein
LSSQVLEALLVSECPAVIIDVLPLLTVGASHDEVARVVKALQQVSGSGAHHRRSTESASRSSPHRGRYGIGPDPSSAGGRQVLSEDLGGLLVPVLGALFDLPLPMRLRKEALRLAREALSVAQDQDVPVVVRGYSPVEIRRSCS